MLNLGGEDTVKLNEAAVAIAEQMATARREVGVKPDSGEPHVSLTRSSILSARTIMIVVRGQAKRDMLEQAIADGQSSKLPIGRVLAEVEQPIDIHWCP